MSAVQHRNMSALHWRPLKPTEDAAHIVTVGWEAIVCSAMAPNGTYPIHTGRLATTRFPSPFPKVAAVIDPQVEGEDSLDDRSSPFIYSLIYRNPQTQNNPYYSIRSGGEGGIRTHGTVQAGIPKHQARRKIK